MIFAAREDYTRGQIQDALAVPDARRDGSWDTGYTRFDDELYVFCNVGSAGRTGHDYNNHWDGPDLVWFAKSGTHVGQPLMARVIRGDLPIHVFWRADSKKPRFRYAGLASILEVADSRPVRFRLGFAAAASAGDAPPVAPVETDAPAAIAALAAAIAQRVKLSGQARASSHPVRTGPPLSDIAAALNEKWIAQRGLCSLCDQPIVLASANRLMRLSPDRIDSLDKSYDIANVHLAHLGCNLAKNDASLDDWREFLTAVRGQPLTDAAGGSAS